MRSTPQPHAGRCASSCLSAGLVPASWQARSSRLDRAQRQIAWYSVAIKRISETMLRGDAGISPRSALSFGVLQRAHQESLRHGASSMTSVAPARRAGESAVLPST